MKHTLKIAAAAAALTLSAAAPAHATPEFMTFGALPQATFGGSGIPNDFVAIATADLLNNDGTATIGLTATRRSPSTISVTNDGAGTFTAPVGTNMGNSGTSLGALWNFDFFVDIDDGSFDDYVVSLGYEFNPAADTSPDGLIALDFMAATSTTIIEGSQNLAFGFLGAPIPGAIVPPSGSFNPNAPGEYTFTLTLATPDIVTTRPRPGEILARVAIDVQVEGPTAVSEPATLGLLGLSLVGMAGIRRRRA